MKNLVEINVVECTKAETRNNETKAMELKKTKDGNQVFNLHYIVKTKKKIGELEIEEQRVEKISSLIELKPGKHLLEVELFAINGKIYPRALSVFTPSK